MKINDQELSIEKLVQDTNPRSNLMRYCGNDIYLSDMQIEILKQYGFLYQNYSSIKSLIFDIEEYINENYDQDLDDLESVVSNLSEFDYYHNTNK